MLCLQRPQTTSRTSSKPPSTGRKERREQAKPGGAKPGHEGRGGTLLADPDGVVAQIVSVFERIDLREVTPLVIQHQQLAVRCPSCGRRVVPPVPQAAARTPFGHACTRWRPP